MIIIRVTGLQQLNRLFDAISGQVNDLRNIWPDIADEVEEKVEDIFSTSGYGSWPPNSPETLKRKAPETRILVDDGNYRQAATNKDDIGNVYSFDRNSMIYGIDESYFETAFGYAYPGVHEEGLGNVPQREVFGLIDDQPFVDEVVNIIENQLKIVIQRNR